MTEEQGTPQRPLHVVQHSWNEETAKLEDTIVDNYAFENKYESFINGTIMAIPDQLKPLLENGGVITLGPEQNLLLFGKLHWRLFQRKLSKLNNLNPVNNNMLRHLYSNAHRFNGLEDGGIFVPVQLLDYAGIDDNKVAIIGMMSHAEVWDKFTYKENQKKERLEEQRKQFIKAPIN